MRPIIYRAPAAIRSEGDTAYVMCLYMRWFFCVNDRLWESS